MEEVKGLFLPAKLASEANNHLYNEPCLAFFTEDNEFNLLSKPLRNTDMLRGFTAPLYQQIIDWFREKGIGIIELPIKIKGKPHWALVNKGAFLGGYEINITIEKAFELL